MYNELTTYNNQRTIGLFPTLRGTITGESWYINQAQRQQSIRQVYTLAGPITSVTTQIPHNIPPNSFTNIVRLWGTFQDATGVWDTLPYVDVVAITNQIKLQLDTTNIIITRGAGAPTISNLVVVVEYLSNI